MRAQRTMNKVKDIIKKKDCHDNRCCVNYAGKHFNERYNCELYNSLAICHDVEYAVVNEDEYGGGVFGWYGFREHAEFNAKAIGGVALPVDRKDGEILIPECAKKIIERFMDSSVI